MKEEWEIKKQVLIEEISNIPSRKFHFSSVKNKLKLNIPLECLNASQIKEAIDGLKYGVTINGFSDLDEAIIKRLKGEIIEIINCIQIPGKVKEKTNGRRF